MDQTETANISWIEFEYYLKQVNEFHPSRLPNEDITAGYRPGYYRDPKFRYYPVIGVTQKQAEDFCKWRSRIMNSLLEVQFQKQALDALYEVRFRLPTEDEWELAAKMIDTLKYRPPGEYAIQSYVSTNNDKAIQQLLKDPILTISKVNRAVKKHLRKDTIPFFHVNRAYPWFTLNEDRIPKNVFSPIGPEPLDETTLYNLMGNVAELVAEPGIVKGGSWRHDLAVSFPSKQIKIDPNKQYDWVGFRCICEVTKAE